MPEGDAVLRVARGLDRALSGQLLTRTDFRVPDLATVDLAGRRIEATVPRGKHLLTRIGASGSGAGHTLHTHLKMEGDWHVYRPGSRWRRPAHEARIVLATEDREAVGFALGIVELIDRDREQDAVGHLGPDLLARDWDPGRAVANLVSDPERTVGAALLDQRVVAGLGTIYVSEACFAHGVRPTTPVGEVGDPDRLLERARQMLRQGVREGRPITTGAPRQPVWVYRRQRQPCLRCQTPIVAGEVGGQEWERTTYWCPSCQ